MDLVRLLKRFLEPQSRSQVLCVLKRPWQTKHAIYSDRFEHAGHHARVSCVTGRVSHRCRASVGFLGSRLSFWGQWVFSPPKASLRVSTCTLKVAMNQLHFSASTPAGFPRRKWDSTKQSVTSVKGRVSGYRKLWAQPTDGRTLMLPNLLA